MKINKEQLAQYEWHRMLAVLTLFLFLALYTVFKISGFAAFSWSGLFSSLWSMRLLIMLPLALCAFRVRREWVWATLLIPILLCFIWQVASLELYAIQRRFFSFAELYEIMTNADMRPLLLEQLFTWKVLIFSVAFYAIYFGLAYGLKRAVGLWWNIAGIAVFLLLMLVGTFCADKIDIAGHDGDVTRLCVMPWSSLSYASQGHPVARAQVAKRFWHNTDPLFWQDGAASYVAPLQDMYKGRGIVVIVMESQGLTYIDGFGEGSKGYKPCSPYLRQLADDNIFFANYFQSGYSTTTAEWSILSSFPYFSDFAFTPHLASLGVISDFKKSGYRCEWLRSATTLFGNLNELLENVGVIAGPTDLEKEQMKQRDDSLWTAWGMPDNQLYEIAYDRISKRMAANEGPFLEFVLTVSNHNPFKVPEQVEGVPLLRGHSGGMRYADACLKTFMHRIQAMDESVRPIVFITADTGFRSGESVIVEKGIAAEPLESLRMPGVLILPQKVGDMHRVEQLFSHEDVLPLLANIVGIQTGFTERLRTKHRVASAMSDYEGHTIINSAYEFYASRSLMAITDYWKLKPLKETNEQYPLMQQRAQWMNDLRHLIWLNASNRAAHPDDRWDAIDNYDTGHHSESRSFKRGSSSVDGSEP